jgi:GTPase SAR1 family protein
MLDTWINFADGFILVYAINDKETFESLAPRYERIVRNKQGQSPKMIMVGNKCDLVSERKVTEQEATALSKQWKVPLIEASALVI